MADDDPKGLRQRLATQGEEALGKLAQDLLENPLLNSALTRALGAREQPVQAQEVAFNAFNIPAAADIERLTRRVRSVWQRLEGIEDAAHRLDERLAALGRGSDLDARLDAIDDALGALTRELAALREALPGAEAPVPREQERLVVPGQ